MSYSRWIPFACAVLWLGMASGSLAADSPQAIGDEFVQKQFGSDCSLIGMKSMVGDFDDDGVDDIAIPAKCTNPLMNQAENNYIVIDPYDAFFGYNNPAVTTQFASEDPQRRGYSLLIIHGAGPDAWRSTTPKAKFMVVNLPFKSFAVRKIATKKKIVHTAIYVNESGLDSLLSVLFWDGRRYRYQPMGSSME